MTVLAAAETYYRDTARLSKQAIALVIKRWGRIDPGDISRSWAEQLPEVLAISAAAQTVGAEMASPYLSATLDDTGQDYRRVDPGGMVVADPEPLFLPVAQAKALITEGLGPRVALRKAASWLAANTQAAVMDTTRLALAAGMTARPHASGFYRMLRPPSCARCAVLAGKFFRWNHGFSRHKNCDCVHISVHEADDSLLFDARKAIKAGKVTGLSKATTRAIVDYGADPAQVVNAASGMYLAMGGRAFTTTGTTRRGVAGARIIARDIDRALGVDVAAKTYTNVTFDRLKAAQYAELFRRGKTFTRTTSTGRPQQYAYRFTRTPRPTPEQIVASAGSRADAVRLLTNYGYLL